MSNVIILETPEQSVELRRGDTWHVRLPPTSKEVDHTLATVTIEEVSHKTVKVVPSTTSLSFRYETNMIKWIERVEK